MIIQYLTTFLLTVLIEFIIYYIFIKKDIFKLFLYSLLITAITFPIATNIYHNYFHYFYIIEMTIVLVESLLLMSLLKIKYKKALLISFLANFITAIISYLFFI